MCAQEWLEKKNRQTKERCMKEKERKRQEKLEKELKQQKNEAAYQEWCEKAKNRPRTAPNSFGYSSGKLRGSYNCMQCCVKEFSQLFKWVCSCNTLGLFKLYFK